MKNIQARQIVFIMILYALSKILWDTLPFNIIPEPLRNVINDFFGLPFFMGIVLFVFTQIFWKVPVLNKLTQFLLGTNPYIQGTWRGRLKYEWEGKKSEKTVFLVIRQSNGYSINIWLLTDERISVSSFADIKPYRGVQRILYTYSNEESPENKEKNPSHEGFCQIDIDVTSKSLHGIYYTTRKTFGELIFDRRHRKIVMKFEQAKNLFGM